MIIFKALTHQNKLKCGCTPLRLCWRFKSTYQNDGYQYIQRSRLPTMHFQKSLPRLPIPELEKTCERYLAAQKPLLSEDEFKKTESYVAKFKEGDGKVLHEQLRAIDKANKHTSYISEPWFDMYLRDRTPLPINYNPLLVFVNEQRPEYSSQLIRSTNFLIASLRFMKSLRAGILEPEVFHLNPKKSDTDLFRTITSLLPSAVSWYGAFLYKAYPLDMSQYPSLFNSTRIPEISKDRLFCNDSARHVMVMKRGHFYIFDVVDKDGNILPPGDLLACMKCIHDDMTPFAENPVGVLTAGNRDTWAKARQHLESIGNAEVLNLIDSSFFNISLDDLKLNNDFKLILHNYLHGDGRNRWFDKSFSLLVASDGLSAVNFEHAWGDGVAILRYFQDIFKDTTTIPQVHSTTKPSNCNPETLVRKLEFKLDDKSKQYIHEAQKNYANFYNSLSISVLEFPNFGRKITKTHQVSPDSIMQLGFQLAFYKQTGKFVPTYESCSTAAFKHGRTETLRPCTTATKAFCEAVNSSNKPSKTELKAMIQKCSQVHGNLTKEAAMGQGFDRHLFALRKLAEQSGHPLPDVYKDPAYASLNQNILSTSTLQSSAVMAGGFGPVVKNGYGIGYSMMSDMLGAVVSCYPPHRDDEDYVNCLRHAFQDIYDVLNTQK